MNYELMLVVSPTADVDPIMSRVEKSVKDTGATSVKINKLGKKPLSYQIAKHSEGEYVLVNFEAPGDAVGAISKRLRLEQEVILRYLIIKVKNLKAVKITEIKDEGEKPKTTPKVTIKTISSKEKQAKVKESLVSKDRKVKEKTKKPKIKVKKQMAGKVGKKK